MPRKHDHAVSLGVTAVILGLLIIGGISFTYMTRPALVEAAAKRVLIFVRCLRSTFVSQKPKNPPGEPMTLGNMRNLGVQRLVRWLRPHVFCTSAAPAGTTLTLRPNWSEQPPRESLTGLGDGLLVCRAPRLVPIETVTDG